MTPQPEITGEQMREWRKNFEADDTDHSEGERARLILRTLWPQLATPEPFDIYVAGAWLWRELGLEGCGEALRSDICFANGQKMAADVNADIWGVTLQTLADFRVGVIETPGPELAHRLFKIQQQELVKRYGKPTMENIARARAIQIASGNAPMR